MAAKNLICQITFLLLILIFPLWGCTKEPEIELPFEAIERAEIPGTGYEYQGREPALVAIAKKEDIDLLGNTVSIDAQLSLEAIQFDDYFAVVVFQGLKGTTMYGVEIQRILRKGNVMMIFTHFTERDPSIGAGAMITSPYHIVKIPRQGLSGNIEFVLYADGQEIIHTTNTIP